MTGNTHGAASWSRNLSRPVEVVTPVLDICPRDRREAWTLDNDGKYNQLQPDGATEGPAARGTHESLMELARRRAD